MIRWWKVKRFFRRNNPNAAYDKYGRCQFKPGQAIVFVPKWNECNSKKGGVVYTSPKGVQHPIRYGDIVHFLAEHSPARGHCIVVDYDGKITTMLHPEDFRLATDEEV